MGKQVNIAAPYLKKFKLLFLIVFSLLAAFISGFFWWHWATAAPNVECKIENGKCGERMFIVKRGEGLSQVAQNLEKQGLIRSSLAFKILGLTQGISDKIQAGDFRLSPSMNIHQIIQALSHGTLDTWITFPEGWRREEYGRRLAVNIGGFDYQEFLKLTKDYEGKLFPDTYLIPKNASPGAVVKILTDNFATKTRDLELNQSLLILASIVEREALYDQDRPMIAGILIKRWQKEWALQADATLQYSVASKVCGAEVDCRWWPTVSGKDKEIDSLYNTYKYKGLPPAPIANPGLASIRAALNPQLTNYWFYLSAPSGKTYYASTLEEHNQNIAKYLK